MAYLGPSLEWKLEPFSPPFVTYRNIESYRLQSRYNLLAKQSSLIQSSWDSTMYYKHKLCDFPIPGNVLIDTILEDSLYERSQQLNKIQTSKNSLLAVTHEDQSLIVHVSGKLKDHLIVRNSCDFRPYHRRDVKGFQVKLDAEIVQLEKFGMGSFNTSSHFLARSLSQIFHLKTTDILDSCNNQISTHNCIIIEPVQKWILQSEISCMSGSKSVATHGFIMSTQGELFTIDCNRGVQRWNRGNTVAPIFSSSYSVLSSSPYSQCMTVESTHHSQICYLSKEKVLFLKDLRSQEFAQPLFSVPHFITSLHVPSSNSNIQSDSNHFFLGIQDLMYVMDARYFKTPLAMRPIPGSPSMMRSHPQSMEQLTKSSSGDQTDLILSSGEHSRQIFTHLYSPNGTTLRQTDPSLRAAFLSSSSEGGIESNVSWETIGFPVIDRSGYGGLRGMDIVQISNSEDKYFLPKYYRGKKDYQKKRPHRGGDGDDDDSENDDNDLSMEDEINEDMSEKRHSTTQNEELDLILPKTDNPLLLLCQQSEIGDVYCQIIEVLKKNSSTTSAPIQLNAPIGVRCPPFFPPVNKDPDSNPYLAQTDIYSGFGLGKTILTEDLKLNSFPLTPSNFTEFVTDRELKRFSVLQLKLHEIIHEKDILKLQDRKGVRETYPTIDGLEQIKETIRPLAPTVVDQIQSHGCMTLWEIWKFITMTLKVNFDIESLRQLISSESQYLSGLFGNIEDYHLQLPPDQELFASSDGLRVKLIASKNFNSKDYFGDSQDRDTSPSVENDNQSLCSCHVLGDKVCEKNEWMDEREREVDVEVEEGEQYDTFDTYAQLSSYSQTLSQRENERNKYHNYSTRATRTTTTTPSSSLSSSLLSSSSSKPILSCCGLETCLVPHLIVYKCKYQLLPTPSSSTTSSTSIPSSSNSSSTERVTPKKKKNTQSDVTFDVISSLKNIWDEE